MHLTLKCTFSLYYSSKEFHIPLYVEKIIEDNLPSVEEALEDLKSAWNESLKSEEKFKSILKNYI